MIKFGFHSIKQLSFKTLNSFTGRRQFIALDFYDQMGDLDWNLRNEVQERMLSRFPTVDGIFKYTFSNRFEEFDDQAEQVIKDNFPDKNIYHLKVHDVGVSDGRTTLSFFERLKKKYPDTLEFLATDYAPYIYSVRRKKNGRMRLLVDKEGNLLQLIAPPFVFNIPRKESAVLYPLNHIIRIMLEQLFAKPLLKQYKKDKKEGLYIKKIALIVPECQTAIDNNTSFHFDEQDIMLPLPQNFNIVRVMNLLNKSYFNDNSLQKAIMNVYQSLNEDGLFIVGSNKERGATVNGAIYKKSGGKITCILVSGESAPVHDIIMKTKFD
ncbi:MAG: hypothetical protein KAJ29_02530 [Alphaproteobacteria bacterium]|nr:hypothetical protein [Alphaproteobacteria bacterium]